MIREKILDNIKIHKEIIILDSRIIEEYEIYPIYDLEMIYSDNIASSFLKPLAIIAKLKEDYYFYYIDEENLKYNDKTADKIDFEDVLDSDKESLKRDIINKFKVSILK